MKDRNLIDDLTQMASGMMNLASGIREQIVREIKSQMEDFADRMDLVPRSDLDRLEAQIKDLETRLAGLEQSMSASPDKSTTKKSKTKGSE